MTPEAFQWALLTAAFVCFLGVLGLLADNWERADAKRRNRR